LPPLRKCRPDPPPLLRHWWTLLLPNWFVAIIRRLSGGFGFLSHLFIEYKPMQELHSMTSLLWTRSPQVSLYCPWQLRRQTNIRLTFRYTSMKTCLKLKWSSFYLIQISDAVTQVNDSNRVTIFMTRLEPFLQKFQKSYWQTQLVCT